MSDHTVLRNQMTRRRLAGPGRPTSVRAGAARGARPARRGQRPKGAAGLVAQAEAIFQMPTVEQVVAAGYPPERWNEIKKQFDELVQRFVVDPAFRADVLDDRRRRPDQE